jgi:hypothetical protein
MTISKTKDSGRRTNMKNHSAPYILPVALMIACVLSCKFGSNKTASSETSSPVNSSNRSAPKAPAAAPDIAGSYNITGTNPTGTSYKGTLQIIPHGDVYQFRWNAGGQYDGVGVENENVVAVSFTNGADGKGCGVVDYVIQNDGALVGKWGYWGLDAGGTENATRSSGSGLVGEYDATGKNPNGTNYKARITVKAAGNLYKFFWSNGSEGLGIKRNDNVAVGIGGARCGFVTYEISADGTLDGIWGGGGSEKTGTERAVKR